VGRIGFWNPEGWPGFEIGWMLRRSFWGRGYATEGAQRALEYAYTELQQPQVISLIHPENAASIRVAQRLLFGRCDKTVIYPGLFPRPLLASQATRPPPAPSHADGLCSPTQRGRALSGRRLPDCERSTLALPGRPSRTARSQYRSPRRSGSIPGSRSACCASRQPQSPPPSRVPYAETRTRSRSQRGAVTRTRFGNAVMRPSPRPQGLTGHRPALRANAGVQLRGGLLGTLRATRSAGPTRQLQRFVRRRSGAGRLLRRPVRRRTAAERDDIAVRILDVEVLRTPRRRGERPENLRAIRDAPLVERFDTVHAGRGIEMLMFAPVLAFGAVLRRFLQMELQPVQFSNRVEPVPRLAEREPELPVVGHRARQIIDQELWSERCDPRLPFEVAHF